MELNSTNQNQYDPKMNPNYDPEIGGTPMKFEESPFFEGLFPRTRHPLLYMANCTLVQSIEFFCGFYIPSIILSDTMYENNPTAEFCAWLERFIGDFAYTIYGILIVTGRILGWFGFVFMICCVLARLFKVGKFKHSKEWYLENYAAWYAMHPESPIFAEKKENPKHEKLIQESEIRFCRHCGKPIRPDMKFCSSCGKQFQ